nr:MAG TPA: hypothetical protein [Caudoviricetes sp.]
MTPCFIGSNEHLCKFLLALGWRHQRTQSKSVLF